VKTDGFGLPLTTSSDAARDAYVQGVDRFLAALPGVTEAFEAALEADQNLALAHVGMARIRAMYGDRPGVLAAVEAARAAAEGTSPREQGHVHMQTLMLTGHPAEAFAYARDVHLRDHPRDGLVAQTACGVFGLIGFSGRPARDAEQLAFTTWLAPENGAEWWFQAQHGFSQLEVGLFAQAEASLDASQAVCPESGHGAHVRSHLLYEMGKTGEGLAYLDRWFEGYASGGTMWCHNHWHVALWALADGDMTKVREIFRRVIAPGVSDSPPINVVTDGPSLLLRAMLAGHEVEGADWQAMSDYAAAKFPMPGNAFVDFHAALAHAMAGADDRLETLREGVKGPVAGSVRALALGFACLATEDWAGVVRHVDPVMVDHVRLGGSNAQRDLIEFALAHALAKLGKRDEAARLIAIRRPHSQADRMVAGLAGPP
jgi:hypothetical protein